MYISQRRTRGSYDKSDDDDDDDRLSLRANETSCILCFRVRARSGVFLFI